MEEQSPAFSARSLRLAALAVATVAVASLLGQFATAPNLDPWYGELLKPAFNPPQWVFAPVWTALYVLMAFAGWRIMRLVPGTPGRSVALMLFFAQLALNAAWSWMFFALHSPVLGLLNIVPQWLLVLVTIERFRRLDVFAAWCLAPLAVWIAYAMALNFAIWRLNG